MRALRFLHGYLRHPLRSVTQTEASVAVGPDHVAATLLEPAGEAERPGWVVLHGITVPGREHPALQRFARSMAASGAVVLVPEIRAWSELRVDPQAADAVIAAAAEHLSRHPRVRRGGVGVVGFSFGATQALATAARPEHRSAIRSVVSFGGYCDPRRTFRFAFTGEHEWRGTRHRVDPDPYGRWIVTANYLTRVPGYGGSEAVAEAARLLAADAGRRGAYAGEPAYDPLKAELRAALTPDERELWDLIAPPTGTSAPVDEARALADAIAVAAVQIHPGLDPRPGLPLLRQRVVLAHGHGDHLIPFTESLRLRDHLAPAAPASLTVTRLFAHSREAGPLRAWQYPVELARYVRLLHRALTS